MAADDETTSAIDRIDPAYRAPVAAFARLHGARRAAAAAIAHHQQHRVDVDVDVDVDMRGVLTELRDARAVCSEWTR
jgi:hypothetical protein